MIQNKNIIFMSEMDSMPTDQHYKIDMEELNQRLVHIKWCLESFYEKNPSLTKDQWNFIDSALKETRYILRQRV